MIKKTRSVFLLLFAIISATPCARSASMDLLSPQVMMSRESVQQNFATGMRAHSRQQTKKDQRYDNSMSLFITDLWEHRKMLDGKPLWFRDRGMIQGADGMYAWSRMSTMQKSGITAFSDENFRQKLAAAALLGLVVQKKEPGRDGKLARTVYYMSRHFINATGIQIAAVCQIPALQQKAARRIITMRKNANAFNRLRMQIDALVAPVSGEIPTRNGAPMVSFAGEQSI